MGGGFGREALRERGILTASPYVALGAAVACVSLGSLFVRVAAAPPLAASFYRVGFACLALLPFAWRPARSSWPALTRRDALLLLACGVALALHFAAWIASLSYTSVAASVLLVNLAPLSTAALSRLFLGEPVPSAVAGAIVLAIAGAGLVAGGDLTAGSEPLRGDLLAVAGALTLSVYHVIGRGLRHALPLGAYVLGVWATAALVLFGLALAGRIPLGGFPGRTWAALAALALVPTLAGHGLVNRALRELPAASVGLFLLGEPVGASLLAWSLLGETPGAWTLAGGVLILAALWTAARAQRS